jgi:hypothetical protein
MHEQLVMKVMPETGERSAHRGLTEIESVTSAGDVALGQQRVQGHEEIEIEQVQVHTPTGD